MTWEKTDRYTGKTGSGKGKQKYFKVGLNTPLTLCMLGNFSCIFCGLLTLFQN